MAAPKAAYVWLNGQYVPWAEAAIHVSCDAVCYGASVFEGLRGYLDPAAQQVYIFRLAEHLDRLWDSISRAALCMSRQPLTDTRPPSF